MNRPGALSLSSCEMKLLTGSEVEFHSRTVSECKLFINTFFPCFFE